MQTLIHQDHHWALWAIILATTAFGLWAERTRWGRRITGYVFCIFIALCTISSLEWLSSGTTLLTEDTMELGYHKTLTGTSFEDAVARTTEVLAERGFGIITEIDVKATMKKKIDEDMRPYMILGACNPGFAFKALSHDPEIGLLLPCNVLVYEREDGDITVSFVKPRELFPLIEDLDFEPLMVEVDGAIRAAYEAL